MIGGRWCGWRLTTDLRQLELPASDGDAVATVRLVDVSSADGIVRTMYELLGRVAPEELAGLLEAVDDLFDPIGVLPMRDLDVAGWRIHERIVRRLVERAVRKGCPIATYPEAQS